MRTIINFIRSLRRRTPQEPKWSDPVDQVRLEMERNLKTKTRELQISSDQITFFDKKGMRLLDYPLPGLSPETDLEHAREICRYFARGRCFQADTLDRPVLMKLNFVDIWEESVAAA